MDSMGGGIGKLLGISFTDGPCTGSKDNSVITDTAQPVDVPVQVFINQLSQKEVTPSFVEVPVGLYGRIDRVIIHEGVRVMPRCLASRPNKSVSFEMPLAFIMGPQSLHRLTACSSLEEVLLDVVGFSPSTMPARIQEVKAGKLDHVLMVLSSAEVPTVPATLEGMCEILSMVHPRTGKRMRQVLPELSRLCGKEKYQERVERFSDHWQEWQTARACMWLGIHSGEKSDGNGDVRTCKCRHVSFETFCSDFDSVVQSGDDESDVQAEVRRELLLLLTREMMFKLLGCNEFFGMDGFIYNQTGEQVGEEFLTVNEPLGEHSRIGTLYLSNLERFWPKG